LVCGHGGRDQRCGILGPLLQARFRDAFRTRGIDADVALISHIGGHKYAGNVIVYLPPGMQGNACAGSGIWYGRVGPDNAADIVDATVVKGEVIFDLLRGGITREGRDIARMLEPPGEEEGLKLRPRARARA
jgi:leucyl-tRNA synthetase